MYRESPRRAVNHCQRCGRCFTGGRVWRWLSRWGLAVMVADEIREGGRRGCRLFSRR